VLSRGWVPFPALPDLLLQARADGDTRLLGALDGLLGLVQTPLLDQEARQRMMHLVVCFHQTLLQVMSQASISCAHGLQ